MLSSIPQNLTRTLRTSVFHHTVCQQKSAVSESAQMRRDREGAVRRFMAAAEALRTASIFARCSVAAPAFPGRLGAMDLFEAFQGAAQAVQQLDEAAPAHARSSEMQGALFQDLHPCGAQQRSTQPPKRQHPLGAILQHTLWRMSFDQASTVQAH